MLNRVYPHARRVAEYPARLLSEAGVSPNAITVAGLCLNVLVAVVLAFGFPVIGGALVLVVNAFDMLDGAVARMSGKVSRFGAMLDSTLDRYSEAAIYLGIMAWLFALGDGLRLLAAYLAIVGSFMVSYARARAEGLGAHGEVGFLPRPERIVLIGLGLMLHQYLLLPILWLLALLTNVTTVQRLIHARRQLRSTETD